VERTKYFTIHGDTLDTEIGDEEPYAKIWQRRVGNNSGYPDDEEQTEPDRINP
jgi:hypothetical protein